MKTSQTLQPIKITVLAVLLSLLLACGYNAKTTPAMAGSMPTIAALSPSGTAAGSPAFTLTVNGSNFGSKAVVNWNGAAQTTTMVSANQLTIAVPAAAVATSTTVSITVTNPATSGTGMYGGGGTLAETSSPMSFAIN